MKSPRYWELPVIAQAVAKTLMAMNSHYTGNNRDEREVPAFTRLHAISKECPPRSRPGEQRCRHDQPRPLGPQLHGNGEQAESQRQRRCRARISPAIVGGNGTQKRRA